MYLYAVSLSSREHPDLGMRVGGSYGERYVMWLIICRPI